jgi:hypothetical protein
MFRDHQNTMITRRVRRRIALPDGREMVIESNMSESELADIADEVFARLERMEVNLATRFDRVDERLYRLIERVPTAPVEAEIETPDQVSRDAAERIGSLLEDAAVDEPDRARRPSEANETIRAEQRRLAIAQEDCKAIHANHDKALNETHAIGAILQQAYDQASIIKSAHGVGTASLLSKAIEDLSALERTLNSHHRVGIFDSKPRDVAPSS